MKEDDQSVGASLKDLLVEMARKPRLVVDMESDLISRGLISSDEGMHSIFRTLAFFRITHEMKMVWWGYSYAVIKSDKPACWLAMLAHAKKMFKTSGAVNCPKISELLAADGIFVDADFVRDMLAPFIESFQKNPNETSLPGDYFYFNDRENNVCFKAKRLLSIVDEISIETLMEAKRVGRNKYNIQVPNSLISKMLSCNGFDVQNGIIKIGSAKPAESTSEKRALIVEIVKITGRCLVKDDFIDQCLLSGANKNTVNSYIASSGLFVTDEDRIYLVGTRPRSW